MIKKISIMSFVLAIIDQVIKLFLNKYLSYKTIIPNVLYLKLEKNYGVAFSMLWNNKVLILIISFLLILFLIYLLNKDYLSKGIESKLTNITYGLLFGGILGNLIDRIVRGYVIDYIKVNIFNYSFPVFNLADSFITIGVILMIISIIREDKKA